MDDHHTDAEMPMSLNILSRVFQLLILVFIIVPLAVLIMASSALLGAVSGVAVGARNFVATWRNAHLEARKRTESAPLPQPSLFNRHPQPAFKTYFYDAAWFAMRYISRNVWAPTRRDAGLWSQRGQNLRERASQQPNDWTNIPLNLWFYAAASGFYVGGAFHYVAAVIIVAVFIVAQVILSLVGMLVSTVLVIVLSWVNAARAAHYRAYFRCPHANCHSEMPIPIYICPNCNREHTRLWPSRYGIFYHRCVCGEKLPTLHWLGRKNVDRICPTCRRSMTSAIGWDTNFHIPIVGGPSAGKSHFLVASTQQLMDEYGPKHQLRVDLADERFREDYQRNIDILRSRGRLMKTSDAEENPTAYNMEIERKRQSVPSLLYLYDAAGEHYGTGDRAIRQVYFKYVHGVVLIIDPFSLDDVRALYSDRITTDLAISSANPDDVYDIMLEVLESHHKKQRGQHFKLPVAVVLTKTDAFDLEEKIGAQAAQTLIQRNPHLLPVDAIDMLVQRFLRENGASNFMIKLHQRFERVKYFSCSTLGPDPEAYDPLRVAEPLLWILGELGVAPVRAVRRREVDRRDRVNSKHMGVGVLGSLRYYVWDSLKATDVSPEG